MAADRTVARSTGPTRGNTRVMRAAQPPTDARAAGPLAMVQRLQRSVGNRATQAVLQRVSAVARPASAIQTKLTVGRPDDVYEREADAAAERITSGQPVGRISRLPDGGLPQPLQRQSEPEDEEPVQTRGETRPVQRLCPECAEGETQRQADEDEEEPVQTRGSALAVQRLCPACREETQRQTSAEDETLQTKATDGGASIDTDVAARAMARSGAGSPLGSSIQAQMEQGFGADFSDVRIHTGSAANEAAQALNARAFTRGSDIYLAHSEHASDTRLMGHELTHVVQQQAGLSLSRGFRMSQGRCQRTDAEESAASGPLITFPISRGRPCEPSNQSVIAARQSEVESSWLPTVRGWFDAHLQTIRQLASGQVRGRAVRVGSDLVQQLRIINRHFAIDRRQGLRVPLHESERLTGRELEDLGQASGSVRRNFARVAVTSLSFDCADNLPGRREGPDLLAEAAPGSMHFTVAVRPFMDLPPDSQRAVVLHEALHANFRQFDHDTYTHQRRYPGPSPLTNADSYAAFAHRVVTGRDLRPIQRLSPMTITGTVE